MKHPRVADKQIGRSEAQRKKDRPGFARSVILLAVVGGATAALFVAYRLGLGDWARTTFSSVEALRGFVSDFGAWAPVAFFMMQVAQVILAPIPGGFTVVVGTLLFGVWGGLALSVAGAVVGSGLLFAGVRRWGRPLVVRLIREKNLQRYAEVLDEKGMVLFAILLIPFMPDDVVCALAGLSKVSLRRFVLLVAIGRTPSWLATALITADLATRSTAVWISAGLIVAALAVAVLPYRKRLENRLLRWAGKGKKR